MAKVLIVLTNVDDLGNSGKKTGWYLPEVAHPYHVLTNAGYKCVFVSPRGGKTPAVSVLDMPRPFLVKLHLRFACVGIARSPNALSINLQKTIQDPGSMDAFKDDDVCKGFLADAVIMSHVQNTMKASDIKPQEYRGVMYAGGHGPMYDLPSCDTLARSVANIYERGGVIGAVCHGPAGLVPLKLSNGDPLVKSQSVTCFTNSEENAVKLMEFMPFPLETRLTELGAKFVAGPDWQVNVQVSGRLVTGQNPASATPMAEAMVKLLNDNS